MKYLVLVPLCCALAAAGLNHPEAPLGHPVSYAEADNLMGDGCAKYGTDNRWYCYGNDCSSGGCGCASRSRLVAGNSKTNIATPCATSDVCTDVQYVLDQQCGS